MQQSVFDQIQFKKSHVDLQTKTQPERDDSLDIENSKKLYCVFCQYHITSLDKVIAVNGMHSHTFSNPAGYVYTVNCFSAATGCASLGNKTSEYTWFQGYEWQIAICDACQQQLGWLFTNSDHFYALIHDRITHLL